jgi:hypothetical protein
VAAVADLAGEPPSADAYAAVADYLTAGTAGGRAGDPVTTLLQQ